MISIKRINEEDIDLCYELDSNTISLWTKKQWANEFKKEGIEVYGVLSADVLAGICVFNIVLDEAHINYFVVDHKFRKKGFGSYLMSHLINCCEILNVSKLFLEVSCENITAEKFYDRFNFFTVGVRKKYYKDGSDALIKEKKLTTK